ncbi:DUF3298 and DUF4163 domain-containing protein [Algoriphagus vanfongensis]|uniref:DUF3298 and DUF4163 domain-containing protein n=1 Tax=Algoriphagus vanfongensis TaxID=426371 RepID=UPI00041D1C9E|nr:DUF3298 and DUF4163 domain-containing protein [Algoriphagus vanfongensis]
MKVYTYFLFVLLLTCQPTKESLDVKTVKLESSRCVDESCAEVNLSWPEISGHPYEEEINALTLDQVKQFLEGESQEQSLEQAVSTFLSDYESFAKEFPEHPAGWTIEAEGNLSYQSDSLLSIHFFESSYMGGAHPNSFELFLNVDASSGKLISNDQLVLQPDRLLELARAAFRDYHEVADSVKIEQDDRFFIPETGFFLPQTMGFLEGKFWLIYNPYEIGPYVMGYTHLSFELEEVRGIVRF